MDSFRRSLIWLMAGLAGFLLGCSRSAPSPARPAGPTAQAQFDVESGPFAAGKKVMVASGCFRCHSINGARGPVGGDLVAGGAPGAPGGADDAEADGEDSPGGFRLGDILAQPLLQTLDRDKDGKLTKDELVVGVKQ